MLEFSLTVYEVTIVLGFALGYLFGESFSGIDGEIKHESDWYKGLSPFWQWFVGCLLDVTHHFQYGLVLILVSQTSPFFDGRATLQLIFQYAGIGLIVSDWKDFQNILKRMGLQGE